MLLLWWAANWGKGSIARLCCMSTVTQEVWSLMASTAAVVFKSAAV
jgi:hypothetical protein